MACSDFKSFLRRMTWPAVASSPWWPAPRKLRRKMRRTTSPQKASEHRRVGEELLHQKLPLFPPFNPIFTNMSTIPVSSNLCFNCCLPPCCHLSTVWKIFNRSSLNILRKGEFFSKLPSLFFHSFEYSNQERGALFFFQLNTNYGSFCVLSSSLSMFYTLRRKSNFSLEICEALSTLHILPCCRRHSHTTYNVFSSFKLSF